MDRFGHLPKLYQVPRGSGCDCICPACNDELIAMQGDLNAWHFAHANLKERRTCPKTATHLFGKKLIAESKYLRMPDGEVFYYSKVELEKPVVAVVADAVIGNGTEAYIVEIEVTNGVSEEKENKIILQNLKAIVIDRSCLRDEISFDQLRTIII